MTVLWTPRAQSDLEGIGDHIERHNPAAADRVVNHIIDSAERLAEHPQMGRAGRAPGTRELIVTKYPYIIPYRLMGDDVEIIAVMHASRKWPEDF